MIDRQRMAEVRLEFVVRYIQKALERPHGGKDRATCLRLALRLLTEAAFLSDGREA